MTRESLVWRLRLAACCLLLGAIAFVQAPGQVVGDTKYDLSVRPGLMLEKVLHLWDPLGNFGQVQNQAYGYLFPMGPFFLVGHEVGLPAWVVQRLWWTLVLGVAFLGVVKLAGVLGIGRPWTRVVAGFAFALSPRMLTNTGPISIENWPSAIAPWVLVPLVLAAQGGIAWRQAARSGFAASFVGGVNAVASAAIVPMAALWLLTRRPSWRAVRLALWWGLFMAMATLWWLVPLLVLGRYSPPFLDYIESAAATTAPATIADALRGTTKWVPYVATDYSAGRELLTNPVTIVQGGLVVVAGVLGLARRDLPERRFLLLSLLAGLSLVTMGHLGSPQGVLAPTLNDLLDGVLAPLRNTHKWDVLVRLPLVLGTAHLLSVAATAVVDGRRVVPAELRVLRTSVVTLVVVSVVGSASLVWSTGLASAGGFRSTPSYWTQAARWLEDHDDGRRTYVAPGSPFGDYVWGTPMDEAVQALADAPWATRSVIPLVPGANIRMMDAIESRLVDGTGSEGLYRYLQRAGVGRILVRADLRPDESTPRLARVRQAILDTPGLVRVASFGPELGGETRLDEGRRSAVFVDDGLQTRFRAIEVYEVQPSAGGGTNAETFALGQPDRFVGDSASLLTALEMDAVGSAPVEFARDAAATDVPRSWVLTDGSRRQEVDYGRVHDNRSASIARDEPWRTSRPVHDYDTGTADRWLAVPELRGARSVRATSSASDVGFTGELTPAAQPFAAVDGDPDTAWVSGRPVAGRHALTIRFTAPRAVRTVRLTAPAVQGARSRSVRVVTSDGVVTTDLAPGDTTTVRVGATDTTFLRVEARSDLLQPLRLSEVAVPGLRVSRPLVLPRAPGAWGAPATIALSVDAGERSACVTVDGDVRCAPDDERLGEDGRVLDRVVRMPAAARYAPTLRVAPWGTRALSDLVQAGRDQVVTASSQATHDPRSGAVAALDGDERTGWVAATDDRDPSLTLEWDRERTVRTLRVQTSPGLVASTPTRVVLDFSDGTTRSVRVRDGRATFDPVRADAVRVRFVADDAAVSGDSVRGTGRELPVGVSEIGLDGVPAPAPLSSQVRALPCGSGPTVTVDGRSARSRLVASPAGLLAGSTATARLCGTRSVTLDAGDRRVTVRGNDVVRPVSLRLGPESATTTGRAARAVEDQQRTRVSVPGASARDLLLVRANQNEGWRARQDGRALTGSTLDGWQQGWRLAGDGPVRLDYAPDRVYRAGLWTGLLTFLLVAAAAWWPRRRRTAPQSLLPAARTGRVVGTVVVLGACVLLAGWPGLVAGGIGGLLAIVLAGRSDAAVGRWSVGVVGAGLGAVYLAYAVRPWGGESAWAGQLTWVQLLALGVVSFAALVGWPRRVRRPASETAGRSTT
ncbi:MAG: alpha-(1-_3)-arabinofuranosyltransferase family protein [Aeromicrobium erythreum]